jgi:uncharacterized protein
MTESLRQLERRRVEDGELRILSRKVGEKDQPMIVGYGAVFNKRSLPMGWFGDFREEVARHAFDKTLATNPDMRCLFNHDSNYILGRTKAGTLRVTTDDHGLRFENDPPETQFARDLQESIKRGDVSQCSFGFYIVADEWSEDADHNLIRTLTEISLQDGDVSPVVYPAYPDTEVDLRSREASRGRLEATAAEGLKRIGKVKGDDPDQIRAYFDARRRKLDLVRNS